MNAAAGAFTVIHSNSYSRRTFASIAACFVLSGATALIYEVLWARMLGLVFGATTLAVSAVLAAFMGGLALGSAIAGGRSARVRRPVLWYGVIEIAIGLYALIVPLLFRGIDSVYALVWTRVHPGPFGSAGLRFTLACLVLIVPTALMGATLPLLSAALARTYPEAFASVTRFYSLNLFGAIIGTIAAGFFLLPTFGIQSTIYFAAAINLAIGFAAIFLDLKGSVAEVEPAKGLANAGQIENERKEISVDSPTTFWLGCAFVSGFVTISSQVAWTRVLVMVIGSSTYAFAIVVALFLLGLALGAFLISRQKDTRPLRRVFKVQVVTAASLFISLLAVNAMPEILLSAGFKFQLASWPGLLALQILSAMLLIVLPATLMGMVMPLVLTWAAHAARDAVAGRVGRTYAINTVGAITGSVATAFVLIPKASTRFTILFATALAIAIAVWAYILSVESSGGHSHRNRTIAVGVVLIAILHFIAPALNLERLSVGAYDSYVRVLAKSRGGITDNEATYETQGPDTHQLLMYDEGPTATVSVRKDWGITSLAINGRTNASDRDDMPTQVMLGQLPVLIAPRLGNALIIGFGSGVTVGAMLQSPIKWVTCVELEPQAVYASRYFEHVNNRPLSDTRLKVVIDDARNHLRVSPAQYDVIVSEPSHPWVPGVANLFTKEFFELGRSRLSHEGVFVQWLQVYQLSTESLRSVLATYQHVFPYVMVFRVAGASRGKDLILLGSQTPLNLKRLRDRIGDPQIVAELARVGMKSEQDITAWLICNEEVLKPAIAGAIINTDDNMHIETVAPREAFLPLMEGNVRWIEALAVQTRSLVAQTSVCDSWGAPIHRLGVGQFEANAESVR